MTWRLLDAFLPHLPDLAADLSNAEIAARLALAKPP